MNEVVRLLLKSLLSGTVRVSDVVLQDVKRCLACILGRFGKQNSPVSFLLFQSSQGEQSWAINGRRALYGNIPSPPLAARLFAIGWYEQKDSDCLYELARMYQQGFVNNDPQPERAFQLYSEAIDIGSVDALNNLGRLLQKGAEGVPADPAEAKTLYTRAISKGSVSAMNNLGRLLAKGAEGVQAEPEKAKELFQRAIDKGVKNSLVCLARLLVQGAPGVEADPEGALLMYTRFVQEAKQSNRHYSSAVQSSPTCKTHCRMATNTHK